MEDMNAFERQLAAKVVLMAGPDPHFNALEIARTAATQSPKWRFQSMFSATKFVVAGAIVALIGGFLLSGVLMQPPETDAPIMGSTPSASAMRSVLPTLPVDSIQTQLLDIELGTQQVSPTVFQVLDDGAGHDLSRIWRVVVDQDDAAWVLTQRPDGGNPRIFRLGEPGEYTPADGIPKTVVDMEVGADGRLYAQGSKAGEATKDDWVVLTDQGWLPATSQDRAAATRRPDDSVGSRIIAADDSTWHLDRYILHQSPDGQTEYRLEDMGFAWGKKWLKETGAHKIRPRMLAAAPDGRIWGLWLAGNNDSVDPGLALAEFDGQTWTDITPQLWRYRSPWPFANDHPGGITGARMSVEADGTLRVAVDIHDFDVHWPGDGPAPVKRVVASWDGSDWVIESRTSWDLASIPDPSGRMADVWVADVAPSGAMVLQIGFDGLDTLLYVIEPEIDDGLDEDALMSA